VGVFERVARPLAGFSDWVARVVNAVYRVLGRPGRLLQDLLNGVWLGHPLHAVIVDVVVGAATAAVLLDLLRLVGGVSGLEDASTWVVGLALLAALGAAVSGLTDFKDSGSGNERNLAGLHGLVNVFGTTGLAVSLVLRLGGGHDAGFAALLIGYLILSTGAFIGGHVVFKYGYTVNHNAFSSGGRAKEFTAVLPVAELAPETPTRAMLGSTALVVVRRGDVVYALRESCPHAGGPLSKGRLEGDTIICPWHDSAIRLRDGRIVHGPATVRQVRYEARVNGDQVEVRGPAG
jgi:nitrite reductase/ring-hydroxylating ferredoxin subunit/uncharacterized membrane protein